MRRFWSVLSLLGFLAALALGAPASADAAKRFWIGVKDEVGTEVTSGVKCRVLTADSVGTDATIYTSRGLGTSATNPIVADGAGVCAWWGPDSISTYDVIVYHQRGIARLSAVAETDHRVHVDRMHPYKHLVFQFTGAHYGAEYDTGIDLPEGAMPVDIIVETTSKGTATTDVYVNVGLLSTQGGDPLGLCSGCLVTTQPGSTTGSPGYFRASASVYLTSGVGQYIGSFSRGSYLMKASTGYVPAKIGGNQSTPGLAVDNYYIIPRGGPTRVTYTVAGTTGADSVVGYVHIFYQEVGNR